MPRKKAPDDSQSPALRQPTLSGFINSKSTSMANSTAKQPTAKTPPKPPKATTSTTPLSKSPTNPTPTTKLKIGPPTPKQRSGTKRKRRGKKKKAARWKNPPDESDDESDIGALQAIRFESQEEETRTGGSAIEVTSSGENEEDQIVSPRRPKRTATQARRKITTPSGSSDSDVEVIGGSADAPRKGKQRVKRRMMMSSDEEDPTETEEEAEPSPKKRRLVKGLKPSASEEEIDLKDEVDEDRECYLQNGNCDHFQGVIFTFGRYH